MRQTILGLAVAIAVVTATAAPASACGGGLFSGACAPCGQAYASPCSQGYIDGGYDHLPHERLAQPPSQYFYANQGPTFTGPGLFAPVQTYQESAVSGWGAYHHNYYYGYDGGRYANATNHDYDGAPAVQGPVIYSYRSHPHYGQVPRHYRYLSRLSSRYGYAPRYYGHRERVLRRYD